MRALLRFWLSAEVFFVKNNFINGGRLLFNRIKRCKYGFEEGDEEIGLFLQVIDDGVPDFDYDKNYPEKLF